MRIGRTIIDTDNMTVEEMDILIKELRGIRARKVKKETFANALMSVLEDAKSEGFIFADKDFGQVIESKDVAIYDERA